MAKKGDKKKAASQTKSNPPNHTDNGQPSTDSNVIKRLADCKEAKPNSDFRVVGPPGHRRLMEIRKLTVPQA